MKTLFTLAAAALLSAACTHAPVEGEATDPCEADSTAEGCPDAPSTEAELAEERRLALCASLSEHHPVTTRVWHAMIEAGCGR